VTTDAQGAASTVVRTSTKAGINRVRVALPPLPSQDIEMRGLPGAPAQITLQADRAETVAGGTATVTLQVADQYGNPVANTPLELAATPADAVLEAMTLSTDASGTARVRLRTSPEATTNVVQATVAGGAPVQLAVSGQAPVSLRVTPATVTVELRGTQRFQAVATDASGHTAEVQPAWKVVGETGTITEDGTFTSTQLGTDAIIATYAELTAGAQLTVVPGAVAQVQLAPTDASLVSGTTQQFQVAAFNAHGHPLEISPLWDVTNNIGTIDASGLFTATTAGTGEVVVKVGEMTSRAQVTVTAGELTTILTSPESILAEAGQDIPLSASGQDAAGNPVPITPTWRLTANLGEVDQAGLFRARYVGTGTIRVEAGPRPVVAEVPVEVQHTALYRIEMSPQTLTMSAGEAVTFSITGYDIFGNPIQVTPAWDLSADLGSLSADGTLVARRVGAMLVRATVDRFSTQASVVVRPGPLAALTLEMAGPRTLTAGASVPITVTGHDAYGNTVAVAPSWAQTPVLGTLHPDGVFRAEKVGTTVITAQSGEQQASVELTVVPGKLAKLALDPASTTLQAGEALTFRATALDAYDNHVTIQPAWRVADDVGEIDASGRFTALQARTSQVIATADGISGSARVTVEPGPLTLLKWPRKTCS
jgi:large repetitive protein